MINNYKNYKKAWTKIEELWNAELNNLLVYDYRYIKTKIRTYRDSVYTNNFESLNLPEYGVEFEFFYNDFYWFFSCLWEKILPARILRQVRL